MFVKAGKSQAKDGLPQSHLLGQCRNIVCDRLPLRVVIRRNQDSATARAQNSLQALEHLLPTWFANRFDECIAAPLDGGHRQRPGVFEKVSKRSVDIRVQTDALKDPRQCADLSGRLDYHKVARDHRVPLRRQVGRTVMPQRVANDPASG
ncbi:hypothetical protein PQQ76_25575 [Paraburkholderia sediminicola]